jgi:two-component system nitrate/nitrite response regulator NarL
MATIPTIAMTSSGEFQSTHEAEGNSVPLVRVIVADSQAIFRAGLRKIFAIEDDIRVVGQAETLPQTISAAKKFSADILIMEAALSPNPADTVSELLRHTPSLRLVVVTARPQEELTLELIRRGAYGVVSRDVEPDIFVDCLRKVWQGEPWLDSRGIQWVLGAYRTQGSRPSSSRSKIQLTPKESLIVSCVTQGMKNKEIAIRVGTTEQVVKNYLRKVYDKLGVADRLELALYCLHNRLPEAEKDALPAQVKPTNGAASDVPSTGEQTSVKLS